MPRYVYRDLLMSKIDDNQVLLTEESMQYFGIRWGDCAMLPFGWTLGLSAMHFFSNIVIVGLKRDVFSFIFYIITSACCGISLSIITFIDNV